MGMLPEITFGQKELNLELTGIRAVDVTKRIQAGSGGFLERAAKDCR